jgi:hypothetical protein
MEIKTYAESTKIRAQAEWCRMVKDSPLPLPEGAMGREERTQNTWMWAIRTEALWAATLNSQRNSQARTFEGEPLKKICPIFVIIDFVHAFCSTKTNHFSRAYILRLECPQNAFSNSVCAPFPCNNSSRLSPGLTIPLNRSVDGSSPF